MCLPIKDVLNPVIPCEGYLLKDHKPREAIDITKHTLTQYAELLKAWPSIVDAAKELQEEGVRMTRVLPQSNAKRQSA